jgi:ribosomal protein S18 acetylase RimI-like enzyme
MEIVELIPAHAADYQRLRLKSLEECPLAFASSVEEESGLTASEIEARLAPNADKALLGAFQDGSLVGICGLMRERKAKLRHKAWIWGMYVAPDQRGNGLGRQLVRQTLERAGKMQALLQVYLGVGAGNEPARKLYESMGFFEVGREPGFLMFEGKLYDEISMVYLLAET